MVSVLLEYIKFIISMVSVLLEYIDLYNQTLPIMLALCLMLLGTYYAQNYAGIIGRSLAIAPDATVLYVHFIALQLYTSWNNFGCA